MSSKSPAWFETRAKSTMSQQTKGIKELDFLREISCIHVEQREDIAICEGYMLINAEDEEMNPFLKEVAIPFLKKLGRARWYRDVVTDLGLALSLRSGDETKEDTKDILDAKL